MKRYIRISSRRPWFYPLLAAASALVFTLATPTAGHAFQLSFNWADILMRGIQVVQLGSMNDRQEIDLGKQIDAQLKSGEVRILNNAAATDYVTQIGQRLIPASDRPNLPYTFQVVDDDGINAFATMGGFVYVNKGLLKIADNEAQLASVLGHEMGHITGKHSIKQMREAAIAQGLLGVAGLDKSQAVQIGVELALRRPHSRRDEFDADQRGLMNVTRARYAQVEMVNFMQKLLASKSSTPAFLNTHPNTADRISQLNRQIQKTPSTVKDGVDPVAYRNRLQALR
jgi:beta-barrel assembly-enhancing protease